MIAMGVGLASVLVPAAGAPRRRARAQHARAPAAEARRDGGNLGDAGRAARGAVRAAGREQRRRIAPRSSIPKLASLYLTHDWNGVRQGTEGLSARTSGRRSRRCSSAFASWSACGRSCSRSRSGRGWLAWRKRLFTTPAFLRASTWAIPVGYIAVTAGWITTEVGRQPYVVYGHLRTADAVTPSLTGADVLTSLVVYIVVYLRRVRRRRCTTSSGWCSAACPSEAQRASRSATSARRGRCRRRPGTRRTDHGARPRADLDARCSPSRVFMYVLLDGFDLGVGILFPFAPDDARARSR